jgi:hypothetical protein
LAEPAPPFFEHHGAVDSVNATPAPPLAWRRGSAPLAA